MERPFRNLVVERHDDVFCVRPRKRQYYEAEILDLGDEFNALIEQAGCRKVALGLGPKAPECLYSVFLAKLVAVQRRLKEVGGAMVLYDVPPEVVEIFEVCRLKDVFRFEPDEESAVGALRDSRPVG
jgi:hypothetical protein